MRAFKVRYRWCLCGAILCAAAAVFFARFSAWHAVALLAAGAVALAFFAFRASADYHAARLIAENPIFSVGVASVAETDDRAAAELSVDVVVSGFGILMDGKPYKFGHGGIGLTSAWIDRESIALSFGGEGKAYSVRMLHGIADKAEVDQLTERLRYETGVAAEVSGW